MAKTRIPDKIKRLVAARARYLCEYCKAPKAYASSPFNCDHILPEALGGTAELENLAHTCEICNGRKYVKTHAEDPLTGVVVPLFHPRNDKWNEHFTWHRQDLYILGITPVGRATLALLNMNHAAVVRMRRLLKLVGEHPPAEH